MNTEYIKDYKYKELKHYILSYFLIVVASVGLCSGGSIDDSNLLSSLINMVAVDVLAGAICTLVFVLNELWSDKSKTRIIYREMPSNAVFSDIASGNIDSTGFNLVKAQSMYAHLSDATASQQTAEWNTLLSKSRSAGYENVIEAERLQLMTRDICMSTISLFIMTLIALVILEIVATDKLDPLKMLAIPLVYLVVMFFVSRAAAKSRANRFVAVVVKNAVINDISN